MYQLTERLIPDVLSGVENHLLRLKHAKSLVCNKMRDVS